jgi:hypothetical protein
VKCPVLIVTETERVTRIIIVKENGHRVIGHRCILEVPCPVCKSRKGWPCWWRNGYAGGTHYLRRREAMVARRKKEKM